MPKKAPGPHTNGKQFKQQQHLFNQQRKHEHRALSRSSTQQQTALASMTTPLTIIPPEAGKDPALQAALALTLIAIKYHAPKAMPPRRRSGHYTRRIQIQ